MVLSSPALRSLRQTLSTSMVFIREWVRSPRSMGMVCPSSTSLARAMAVGVPKDRGGLVVELGAGTGKVTLELLRRGVNPRNLVVVEQSSRMVQLLRRRFPTLTIVQGDASSLSTYLPKGRQVDCIVSSLPLISLKEDVRTALIEEMYTSLADGGVLIQYTYSWSGSNGFLKNTFRFVDSRKVWNNVPPARVFRFVRQQTQ